MGYVGAGRFLVALVLALLVWSEMGPGLAEGRQTAEPAPVQALSARLEPVREASVRGARSTRTDLLSVRARFPVSQVSLTVSPTPTPAPTPEPTTTPAVGQPLLRYMGVFRTTAYSDSPRNGTDGRGITRSGQRTRWGVVAVDPAVVPLHSRLMIEGMGDTVFDALDTGGGIRGNWLDIWFSTDWDALQYGVQDRGVFLVVE